MTRGNHQEAICRDFEDRRMFVLCLAQAREKTRWQVPAYVLMGNLVAGMQRLQGTFTQRLEMGDETRVTRAEREIVASIAGRLVRLKRRVEAERPTDNS